MMVYGRYHRAYLWASHARDLMSEISSRWIRQNCSQACALYGFILAALAVESIDIPWNGLTRVEVSRWHNTGEIWNILQDCLNLVEFQDGIRPHGGPSNIPRITLVRLPLLSMQLPEPSAYGTLPKPYLR
ncbi:hypothetical protein FIBSPDRAFT_274413 [Athelia psychrophila]|uniref:Uncharacterized protein n=1 Tax=Athelia psychrophila TaxID=1759441 RepID=A0A166RAS6_9AGAM|nr:hypothetical protein FIBSPDRAFT_274413 [Fibularhizoctonia sp. CBS 109695]